MLLLGYNSLEADAAAAASQRRRGARMTPPITVYTNVG
jgi:hypothetical protein